MMVNIELKQDSIKHELETKAEQNNKICKTENEPF
jgi:hypothetical protein